MPINRFFYNNNLVEKEQIIIENDEFVHLKVMRIKKNDLVEIINGRGVLAKAKILQIKKKQAFAEINEIKKQKPDSIKIILNQANLFPSRMEWLIEKATELGVNRFNIILNEKKLTPKKIDRFKKITISALKQSGRLYIPSIYIYENIDQIEQEFYENAFLADINGVNNFCELNNKLNISIFIGPEGGFSEEEKKYFFAKKIKAIKLNNNILRSETAAISAISSIYHYF